MLVAAGYLLLTLIWGTTWYAIRVQMDQLGLPLLTSSGVRFVLAGAALWIVEGLLLRGRPTERSARPLLALLCWTSIALPYALLYAAATRITSGLTSVLYAVSPILTSILAHWALRAEPLRPLKVVGLALGFAGIAGLLLEGEGGLAPGDAGDLWARAAVVGAAFLHVLSTLLVKGRGAGLHPLRLARFTVLGGGLLLLGAGVLAGEAAPLGLLTAPGMASLLYLALVGSALALTLYYALLRRLPATVMSLLAFLTPLAALVVGRLWDGERFEPRSWALISLVLAGVLVVVRGSVRPVPRGDPASGGP